MVSGCIKSAPTELLPILSGIEPMESHTMESETFILNLRTRAMETLIFFTRLQYLHLQMEDSKSECRYQLVRTTTCLLIPGSSILGEDDGKILTTSSIISSHTQALNRPAMILNEVNGYCLIASVLVMVDMQASCIKLVCVRIQFLYVVQFKLLNTYWIVIW